MELNSTTGSKNIESVFPFSDRQNICAEGVPLKKHGKSKKNKEIEGDEVSILPDKKSSKVKLVVGKKNKIEKCKTKTNLVEKRKRKLSGNIEYCKKIKRKKKDENMFEMKSVSEFDDIIIFEEVPSSRTLEDTETSMHASLSQSFDLNMGEKPENSQSKEKVKTLSAKKLKPIINACKEALATLSGFSSEILNSLDASLKILKDHNFLNNRFITLDTLIELIKLALETSKSSLEVSQTQDINLSKIVFNISNAKSLKNPKAKRNILNISTSPKSSSLEQAAQVESTNATESDTCHLFALKQSGNSEDDSALSETQKKNIITNYFKKLDKISVEKSSNYRCSSLWAKADILSGLEPGTGFTDLRRQILDEELENQNSEINYLIEKISKLENKTGENRKGAIFVTKKNANEIQNDPNPSNAENGDTNDGKRVALQKVNSYKEEGKRGGTRMKAKLLQFHDNRRPPYWGTWRRKSKEVNPRKPFGKDQSFNYDVDSDEEWEGEEEPGESLYGSDEEKEPEEDYEVDNDFFVPHGYLSDDENPEKENMPLKAKLNLMEQQLSSELKEKSKKMTPIVLGCHWSYKETAQEDALSGSSYENLQLQKLRYIPWSSFPIEIEKIQGRKGKGKISEQETVNQGKKPRMKITFPQNEVASLIKIIHGSPQNSDILAKKFLSHRKSEINQESGKRSGLTKKCVLEKIKEIASWQASQDRKKMCWLVSKDTLREFSTEIGPEPAPKNPQKCYIWKFIKKVDKKTGIPTQVPQDPEVVFLES